MIHIISQDNHFAFGEFLNAMFLSRRARYVEGTGWDAVPGDDGWDTDKFDHEHTVYLLCISEDGNVRSSVRLIPSTAPHVISGKLDYLRQFLPPQSPKLWLIDRFVSDPTEFSTALHLASGIMEYANEQAIASFIRFGVAETLDSQLNELGWQYDRLGTARGVCVARLDASYDALAASRALTGIDGSVLSHKAPAVILDTQPSGQREASLLIDAIHDLVDREQSGSTGVIKGLHAELSRRTRTR